MFDSVVWISITNNAKVTNPRLSVLLSFLSPEFKLVTLFLLKKKVSSACGNEGLVSVEHLGAVNRNLNSGVDFGIYQIPKLVD